MEFECSNAFFSLSSTDQVRGREKYPHTFILVTRTGTTEGPFVKYSYLRKFPQLTEAVK